MELIVHGVEYWQQYEKHKNKEYLNFKKNKKMEQDFKKLLEKMKKKADV